MNSQTKATIIAVILVAINWRWVSETKGPNMTHSIYFDGAGLGLLVCGIIFLVLVVRLYRLLRVLLDKMIRVPKSLALASWAPVVVLLPLFFSVHSSITTTSGDTTTTISRGYGSDASAPLFLLASATLLALQTHSALRRLYDHDQSA